MAKMPITVRGWNNLTEKAVEEGLAGLAHFVKVAREDRVTSDYSFTCRQTLSGKYAVGSDGQLGLVVHTPENVPPVAGQADTGYAWTNEGDATVTIELSVSIVAKDERLAAEPARVNS